MRGATGIITTKGVILCILITWICALPLQRIPEDSDEQDSDEEEKSTTVKNENITDQELTDKATLFLTRYFANYGTESPLHIPTNLNHTIVISVVPNGNGLPNSFVLGTTEGPPTFVGDLHLYQSQRQQQQQEQLQLQQQQLQLLQQQELFHINNEPELERGTLAPLTSLFGFVPVDQIHRYKPQQPVEPPPQLPIPGEPINQYQQPLNQQYQQPLNQQYQQPLNQQYQQPLNQQYQQPLNQQYQEPIVQTTPTTTQAPVKNEPVDNIEDAILEALSIAEGGSGQPAMQAAPLPPSPSQQAAATPLPSPVLQAAAPPPPSPVQQSAAPPPPPSLSQANVNYQNLIDSGAIPGLQNNQENGVIKVPSSFGDVFIKPEGQSTQTFHKGAAYNTNTPAPPPPQPVTQAPVAAPPQVITVIPEIVFLNPYVTPTKNAGNTNQVPPGQKPPGQTPPGAQLIDAASNIFESISTGNLGSLVQNTIKLAEVPLVQDAAKLGIVTILHNGFQGFNCNLLGNCNNNRLMLPNLKKDKNS